MDNFRFYSPTFFEFGRNAEEKVGQLLKKFGATKVLIHYGGGSVKKSGLYDKVISTLKKEKLDTKKEK